MSNAWQLAVVDWDRAKMKCDPSDPTDIDFERAEQILPSGTPVYTIGAIFNYGSGDRDRFNIWIPDEGVYNNIIKSAVVPILRPKDRVDAELKFGIDLSGYAS